MSSPKPQRLTGLGMSTELANVAGARRGTVAAAGSAIGDAAAINFAFGTVTGADGTKGAQLNAQDDHFIIYNVAAANLKLYPPTGAAFNGGTANEADTIAATETAHIFKYSATSYYISIAVVP